MPDYPQFTKPLALSLLLALFTPITQATETLTRSEAIHLLNRTGFGVDPQKITSLQKLTKEQAVDGLLTGVTKQPKTELPKFRTTRAKQDPKLYKRDVQKLRDWWLYEMLTTESPLTERLTLFWHGHFTSQMVAVKIPHLMLQQNLTLRQHALGNFDEFLQAMIRDPAILLYLDNNNSKKGNPNENFARELLELFTLGEGNYSEADVQAAAAAFTGWSVSKNDVFEFNDRIHDASEKTFLGRKGTFNGEQIADILLRQPVLATYLADKLWFHFVSMPDQPAQTKLAEQFRNSGYDLQPLLRSILMSDVFWSPEERYRMIKSPAEFVVGAYRYFQVPVADISVLNKRMSQMGQNLFDPPDVNGWPGGNLWIDSDRLLKREAFLTRLRGEVQEAGRIRSGAAYSYSMNSASYTKQFEHNTNAASMLDAKDYLGLLARKTGQPAFNTLTNLK